MILNTSKDKEMSDKTPTLRLPQRLVSFDGGTTFKPAFAATADELDEHWLALLSKMEDRARAQTERLAATENRKAFLATYLSIASSHLVVGHS